MNGYDVTVNGDNNMLLVKNPPGLQVAASPSISVQVVQFNFIFLTNKIRATLLALKFIWGKDIP